MIVDRRQSEEFCRKWREEHPDEAKELDEIVKDRKKLMAWLKSKGFDFPEGEA